MKNYTVYIERDEDGVLVGSVPSLPGCYSQGTTLDELLANMREVVALCVRNQSEETNSEFIGVQNLSIAT
jgi:predicted RNase H-like HicB family nuclease